MVNSLASLDDDAAAGAAIAAIGSALRDVPLATKAHTAIAAATGLQLDLTTINKHTFLTLPKLTTWDVSEVRCG